MQTSVSELFWFFTSFDRNSKPNGAAGSIIKIDLRDTGLA
jgi:hypothetical protein